MVVQIGEVLEEADRLLDKLWRDFAAIEELIHDTIHALDTAMDEIAVLLDKTGDTFGNLSKERNMLSVFVEARERLRAHTERIERETEDAGD